MAKKIRVYGKQRHRVVRPHFDSWEELHDKNDNTRNFANKFVNGWSSVISSGNTENYRATRTNETVNANGASFNKIQLFSTPIRRSPCDNGSTSQREPKERSKTSVNSDDGSVYVKNKFLCAVGNDNASRTVESSYNLMKTPPTCGLRDCYVSPLSCKEILAVTHTLSSRPSPLTSNNIVSPKELAESNLVNVSISSSRLENEYSCLSCRGTGVCKIHSRKRFHSSFTQNGFSHCPVCTNKCVNVSTNLSENDRNLSNVSEGNGCQCMQTPDVSFKKSSYLQEKTSSDVLEKENLSHQSQWHGTDHCPDATVFLSPIGIKCQDRKFQQTPVINMSFKAAVTPSTYLPVDSPLKAYSAKEKVLSLCSQDSAYNFKKYCNERKFEDMEKVGEGSFGEVFTCTVDNMTVALKIVPVDGDVFVNGQEQQTFEDVLTEIAIVKELTQLSCENINSQNVSPSFVQLHSVSCCRGSYPAEFLRAWKTWDKLNESENDCPAIFDDSQLYVIFETDFAGKDLEHTELSSVAVGRSVIHQVTAALSVAESELDFEHRDLHWGNVLISPTTEPTIGMKLDGCDIEIESKGVKVTIIDFTLSRLMRDECVVYTDLEKDDTEALFCGEGDYQFDIYRLMRDEIQKDWERYCPKTNVLWIKYITDKICKKKLRKPKTLISLLRRLCFYESAHHVLTDKLFQ